MALESEGELGGDSLGNRVAAADGEGKSSLDVVSIEKDFVASPTGFVATGGGAVVFPAPESLIASYRCTMSDIDVRRVLRLCFSPPSSTMLVGCCDTADSRGVVRAIGLTNID